MAIQQQINLYQPRFRKQEKVFAASSMLIVLVVAILLFGGIYGYAKWNVAALATENNRLVQQQTKEVKRLESLALRYPVQKKSRLLAQQLDDLQNERRAKQFLIKTLAGRSIGNSAGFSSYFAGVARQNISGMWVDRLELAGGGDVIGIYGSTLKPELVPQFIQALSAEESFAGSQFQLFSMQRNKDNNAVVNFSLRTVVGSKP
ncbi:MAG: hypothetical protein KAT25_06365 [Sulfuriflexus sp.]|nr:hypothetical protein [Sulfuriflexus sp.]